MFFIDICEDINFTTEISVDKVVKNLFYLAKTWSGLAFYYSFENCYLQDDNNFEDTNFI